MFVRFERQKRRLFVALVINRKVGGKTRQDRLGYLGSVTYSEPISTSDRIRFWAQIERRQREIDAKYPGRVTPADVAKIKDAIDKRIPLSRTADERKLFFQVSVVRDAMAAFDALDHAEDAMTERRGERADRRAPSRAAATPSARP